MLVTVCRLNLVSMLEEMLLVTLTWLPKASLVMANFSLHRNKLSDVLMYLSWCYGWTESLQILWNVRIANKGVWIIGMLVRFVEYYINRIRLDTEVFEILEYSSRF